MGKGWGKGNSGDDDKSCKCGSLVLFGLIYGFVTGCIFASYAPWVEYDTAACAGPPDDPPCSDRGARTGILAKKATSDSAFFKGLLARLLNLIN